MEFPNGDGFKSFAAIWKVCCLHVMSWQWCRGISSLLVKDFESIGLNYIRNSFPPGTLFVVWFVVVRSHEVSYKLLLVNVWKNHWGSSTFCPTLDIDFYCSVCWKRGELSFTWYMAPMMLSHASALVKFMLHAASFVWQARSTLKGEPIAFDEIGPPRIRWGS